MREKDKKSTYLLSSKDKTLLIRRNSFLILNLLLHSLDRVAGLDVESDGLSGKCLYENLHVVFKFFCTLSITTLPLFTSYENSSLSFLDEMCEMSLWELKLEPKRKNPRTRPDRAIVYDCWKVCVVSMCSGF